MTWDQTVTYSLAMDAENTMYNTWFRAAGRTGIPSAFLIGRDGVVEWIGHPAEIDQPLAKVVEGKWDRAAAIAKAETELKEMQAAAALRKVLPALQRATKAEDWPEALALIDDLIKQFPESSLPRLRRLAILSQSGRTDEASALLQELVRRDWEKGEYLTSLAGGIVAAHFPGTLDDAESIAKRAVELSQEKGLQQLHTLAAVYAEKGQLDDAIRWEKKALEEAGTNKVIELTLRRYEARKAKAQDAAGPEPKMP
jgi:tetratricopeptide (TPR) repeat protein